MIFFRRIELAVVKEEQEVNTLTMGLAGVELTDSIDFMNKLRESCEQNSIKHYHPHILFDQPNSLIVHVAQKEGRWNLVEESLVQSIQKLANSGADFAIVADANVERVMNNVRKRSSIPVIATSDVVPEACLEKGIKKIGLLGSSLVMADPMYALKFKNANVDAVAPYRKTMAMVESAINEKQTMGKISKETLENLMIVVQQLKDRGCQGLVITDPQLCLILNSQNCGMPIVNAKFILAEAAVEKALFLQQKNVQGLRAAL